MRSLAVLLVLLGAGCVTPASDAPAGVLEDDAAPEAAGLVMSEFGCHTAYVFFQEPPGWSEGRLPPGFSSVGTLQTKAWTCPRADIDGEDIGPTRHALFYMDVDAPEEWGGRGFVVFDWATDNARAAELLASWGLPVQVGEVAIDVRSTPVADEMRITARAEGFALDETTVTGPMREASAYVARYFAVKDATLLAAVDIPVSAGGMASGGLATVEVGVEGAPYPAAIPAGPAHQAWGEDELAYEWHFVPKPSA